MNKTEMIAQLREQRKAPAEELRKMIETAAKFNRGLSSGEKQRFNAAEKQVLDLDERINELTEQRDTDAFAAVAARKYAPAGFGEGVTGEPEVYRGEPDSPSYFRDLYRANRRGDRDAMDRLARNNVAVSSAKAARGEQRAISTSDGAGGEWVPPMWLSDAWVHVVRPGRVTANLSNPRPLPPGTDSINIPKMISGTTVAVQATQGATISQTDVVTGSIASPVITLAGGQTVSMQLVDQSPLNIDELILADLAADYALKANVQVLSGSGTSGQATGLLTLSGTNSIAWTQATPSVAGTGGLYGALGAAISAIHTSRLMPPDCIVMHPRRWAWIESRSDANNRPIVVPGSQNPQNSAGVMGPLAAEGRVGEMLGLPVYTDASIPTNLGAGTNQDVIILTRSADLFMWESSLRAEAFEQTRASTLELYCRAYSYISFQPGRYPSATALITGTGSISPVF